MYYVRGLVKNLHMLLHLRAGNNGQSLDYIAVTWTSWHWFTAIEWGYEIVERISVYMVTQLFHSYYVTLMVKNLPLLRIFGWDNGHPWEFMPLCVAWKHWFHHVARRTYRLTSRLLQCHSYYGKGMVKNLASYCKGSGNNGQPLSSHAVMLTGIESISIYRWKDF